MKATTKRTRPLCGVSIEQLGLAPHTRAALDDAGVRTLSDWRRLGAKRKAIFGVTPSTVGLLDEFSREATA